MQKTVDLCGSWSVHSCNNKEVIMKDTYIEYITNRRKRKYPTFREKEKGIEKKKHKKREKKKKRNLSVLFFFVVKLGPRL